MRRDQVCLSLLAAVLAAPASAADSPILQLPDVTISARRNVPELPRLYGGAPQPGTVDVVDVAAVPDGVGERAEDLLRFAGIGSTSTNSGGMGLGLNLRGFDLGGRAFVNGHPDVFRLFVRDIATVDRIEVLKGHSSVLYGQGAPGGTVNFVLARPRGAQRTILSSSVDDNGWARVVVDHDQPLGAGDEVRVVYAGQAGPGFIDKVDNRRQSLLVSGLHRLAGGTLRAELEAQHNERPFPFGTVYDGGRFWFDRYYLAPQTQAQRHYRRAGVYWDQELVNGWNLSMAAHGADLWRRETLAGFWSIASPTTLSTYYRRVGDSAQQQNLRIELRGKQALGALENAVQAGYQLDRQHFDFSGPQNFEAGRIDLAHPDFNLPWDAMPLQPRASREHMREAGVFLLDQLQFAATLHAALGVRRSAVRIATSSGGAEAAAADIAHTTTSSGLSWDAGPGLELHATRSESFDPNRGQTHLGAWLPPRVGRQWETGAVIERRGWALKLAWFDIGQSNLTAADPQDKFAFVTIGKVRARGLEMALQVETGALRWRANLTRQRVWNAAKTSPSLADRLVNVPTVLGALEGDWRTGADWQYWGALAGVGQRAGNTRDTFRTPGYAILSGGLRYRIGARTTLGLTVANIGDVRYVEALTAEDNVYQGERRRTSLTLRYVY